MNIYGSPPQSSCIWIDCLSSKLRLISVCLSNFVHTSAMENEHIRSSRRVSSLCSCLFTSRKSSSVYSMFSTRAFTGKRASRHSRSELSFGTATCGHGYPLVIERVAGQQVEADETYLPARCLSMRRQLQQESWNPEILSLAGKILFDHARLV